jgi:hypothetical protein
MKPFKPQIASMSLHYLFLREMGEKQHCGGCCQVSQKPRMAGMIIMSRCAIVHVLKGLEDAVPLSIAVPGSTGLWEFKPEKFLDKPEVGVSFSCFQIVEFLLGK